MRDRVGVVIIDEIPLTKKWLEFRPDYAKVYELRGLLRQDTVRLGALATVSAETEKFVLDHCGFREVGDKP